MKYRLTTLCLRNLDRGGLGLLEFQAVEGQFTRNSALKDRLDFSFLKWITGDKSYFSDWRYFLKPKSGVGTVQFDVWPHINRFE
jgi:hypothetical protein